MMGRVSKRLSLALGIVFLLFVTAACGTGAKPQSDSPKSDSPKSDAPKSDQVEAQTVNVGVVPSLSYISLFVGVEKGIFLKYGLDMKVKTFGSGPEASKALDAGDVEIGAANMATFISPLAQGAKLRAFTFFHNDPTLKNDDRVLSIIAAPNSSVQKLSDLVGKKVGRTPAGAIGPYLILNLQEAGVDPKQVTIVDVSPHANVPAALKAGGIDAAAFLEPYGSLYLHDVPNARVLARGGGKVTFKILAIARADWLEQKRATAEKFAIAIAEADQYVRQHLDESADIATRWISGLDLAVAKASLPSHAYDPRFSKQVEAAWEQENKTLLTQGTIKQVVPFAQAFDTTLAASVVAKYPQFFADVPVLSQ